MACGSVGQRAIASSYTNEDELMDQVLHPSPSGSMETAHYLVATAHSNIRSRDDGRVCFQPSSNRFPPTTPPLTRRSDTGALSQPSSFPFGPVTLTMLTLLRDETLRREPELMPAVVTADGSPPATRDKNWRCETAAAAPFNEDVAPSNSVDGTRAETSPSTPEAQAAEPQPQAGAPKIQHTDRSVFGDLRGFSHTVHSTPAGGEIPPLPPLPYPPRISSAGSAQGGDHVRQPAAVVAMVGRQQAASPTYGSTNPTGGAPRPPPPQSGWQPQELPGAAEGVAPTIEAAAVTLRGASTAAMPVSTARDNLFGGGGGGASAYAGASLPPSQSWPGLRAAEYDIGSWCTAAAAAAEPVQLNPNAGGTHSAPSTLATDVATADPNAAAASALPGGFHPSPLTNYSVDARSSAAAAAGVSTRTAQYGPSAPLRGAMPPPVQVQVASRCRRGANKSTAARGRVTRGAVGVFHPRLYLGGGDCIECGSDMMSRGRFERLAGTATAKWHVSIKVLPSGMTLGRWLKQHGLPILQGRPRRRRFASEDGEENGGEQDEVEVDADAAIEPTAIAAAVAAANARSDDTRPPPPQLHATPPPPLPPLCAPSPPPIFPVQGSTSGPSPSSVGAAATTSTAAPSLPATASAAATFTPAAPSTSGGVMSCSSGHETGSGAAAAEPLDTSLMELLQSSGILDDIYSMNERSTNPSAGAAPPCGYPVASASSLPTPPLPSTQAPAAPSLQLSARAPAAGSVSPLSELQEGNMYGSRRSVSGARQVPDQDTYATVPWAGCGGGEGPFSTAAAVTMISSMGGGCGGGAILGGSGNGSAGGSSNGGGGKSDSGNGVGIDPCASAHLFSASTQDAASRTAMGVPPPSAAATYANNGIGVNNAGCGVPSAVAAAAATTCDASAGGGPYGGDGGSEANGWQLGDQLSWCRAYSSAATPAGAAVTVAAPGLSSSGGGKYAAAANQRGPHPTALQQQQQQPAPPSLDRPPPPPALQQQLQQQPHLVPLAPGRCVFRGRERAASNSSSAAHPPPPPQPPQPPLQLPPPHPVSQQLEQTQPSSLLPYQSQRPDHRHHHHLPQSPAQLPNHHPGRFNHYHPQFHQHHHHPPYRPYSPYQPFQYPPRLHHYQQQQLRHYPYELSPSRALQRQRYDVRHGVRLGVQQTVYPEAELEAWRQRHQHQHLYAAAARSVGGGADGSPRRPFKVYDRASLGDIERAVGWARSQPEPLEGPRAPAPLFSPPVAASTFPPRLLASWECDAGGGDGDAGVGWRGHER